MASLVWYALYLASVSSLLKSSNTICPTKTSNRLPASELARSLSECLATAIADLGRRGLGHPQGGPMIAARMKAATDGAEGVCRGLYETWLELILQRNKGRISRDDVNFIMEKIDSCAQAQARNIRNITNMPGAVSGSMASVAASIGSQAQTWSTSIVSNIRRDLEIKIREQDAFPAPDLRFIAFLRAFGESWLTKMSGPLTVPFAIAALFMSGYPRLIFAVLALAAGVFSSYHVWRRAKLDKESSKT